MALIHTVVKHIPQGLGRSQLRCFYDQCLIDSANSCFGFELPASDVQRNQYGQPCLGAEHPEDIYLSLSHSGDYVAAMACSKPCGIDIERIKKRSVDEIWLEIRHPKEPLKPESLEEFYQWWTRKEAAWKVFACQQPKSMKALLVISQKVLIYKGLVLENMKSPTGYALTIAHQ